VVRGPACRAGHDGIPRKRVRHAEIAPFREVEPSISRSTFVTRVFGISFRYSRPVSTGRSEVAHLKRSTRMISWVVGPLAYGRLLPSNDERACPACRSHGIARRRGLSTCRERTRAFDWRHHGFDQRRGNPMFWAAAPRERAADEHARYRARGPIRASSSLVQFTTTL
jgi:hypothetical protein